MRLPFGAIFAGLHCDWRFWGWLDGKAGEHPGPENVFAECPRLG